MNQRLFSRDYEPDSWFSFPFEFPQIAPVTARQASASLLISDEMMYSMLGHKTYRHNLDGVLQSLIVTNLAGVLQRCYIWSSMVSEKSFSTYEELLLLYWFYLGRYLNHR